MNAPAEPERLAADPRFGGREAVDALLPVVYQELRDLAHHQRGRPRAGDTLNTTALVHEAYLRLVETEPAGGCARGVQRDREAGHPNGAGRHGEGAMDELTPKRWRRIRELFDVALDASPAARPALLDALCGDDVALRSQVEALITAESGAGGLIEVPIAEAARPLLVELSGEAQARAHASAAERDPLAGGRAGAYRLVRQLARGGMGTVYLAERDDGQFEQRVAVKLLRRGLDTDDLLRRFLGERQILASLSHPNIARLLDGGATEDGRPYLVMEYVDGRPIDVYCDAKRLTVRERLGLFVTVARAVQHAHGRLVVHRDLKPGNILVSLPLPPRGPRRRLHRDRRRGPLRRGYLLLG